MLASLRPCSPWLSQFGAPCINRSISSTVFRAAPQASSIHDIEGSDEEIDASDGLDYETRKAVRRRFIGDATAEPWLKGDGLRFRDPKRGPNWLGGNVPFPTNPSFCPPPPIRNKTLDDIYSRFMRTPEMGDIRALSSDYGISLKRVDAILRLKGLEQSWKKGKPLQTGFQAGMERMLIPDLDTTATSFAESEMKEADIQDEAEGKDNARDRYQRHYWEPVASNEESIVAKSLKQSIAIAKAARQTAREAKSSPSLLTGSTKPLKGEALKRPPKILYSSSNPSRPLIKFMDVGGKFADVKRLENTLRNKEQRKKDRLAYYRLRHEERQLDLAYDPDKLKAKKFGSRHK